MTITLTLCLSIIAAIAIRVFDRKEAEDLRLRHGAAARTRLVQRARS